MRLPSVLVSAVGCDFLTGVIAFGYFDSWRLEFNMSRTLITPNLQGNRIAPSGNCERSGDRSTEQLGAPKYMVILCQIIHQP